MPRVRKGPGGPKRSAAGSPGSNKKTPTGGASGSPRSKSNMNKGTGGSYRGKKGY